MESRLQERLATTEEGPDLPEAFSQNRRGLPMKLFTLRQKLYLKAKQEPKFRFYALYDRIFRRDVLGAALALVAKNGGSPGVDGVSIRDIMTSPGGPEELVETLHQELRQKRYKPQAVKRVYIPKPDGSERPLGIPTVRDRVVQMATLLILEPIFEADFLECSHGYRPARSAHDALGEIEKNLKEGYRAVYDADLAAYFDTIPHGKLLKCVERRISDRSVLRLLRLWLSSPVEERGEDGRRRIGRPGSGTPQGGVISPLLANLYLHWFDVVFHRRSGPGVWARARLVRYADDFLVMARYVGSRIESWVEETLEGWLDLEINRRKTRVITLLEEGDAEVEFLGYTFRYESSLIDRKKRYLAITPSKKAIGRQKDKLRDLTSRRQNLVPLPVLINVANRQLRGWANYFSVGHPRRAYRVLNAYAVERFMLNMQRRSQRASRPPRGSSYYQHLTRRMGLVQL